MKKIFIILFLVSFGNTFSQNLVMNGNFEQYSTCPSAISQIYRAVGWFQPSIFYGDVINSSNSDYFHSCTGGAMDVPKNYLGFQYANSGNGYAGCWVFVGSNVREYLEGALIDTLQKEKKYCVEFYVSLADSSYWAIADLGLYFSQDSVLVNNYYNIPYIPQIINSSNIFLNDTANWTKVQGIYVASGGEKFITIGNFKDNITTNATGSTPDSGAYYYIDDVSVTLCADTCNPPVAKFNFITNDLKATFTNLTDTSATSWQWYFGDEKTDTAQNPVHAYDTAGTYTVTLVACNQTGCCNELCCDTMVAQVSVSVGLDELNNEKYKLQIYPNPASGSVTVTAEGGDEIIITDVAGRKFFSKQLTTSNQQLSTNNYDNGIYFIALYNNTIPISVKKLIIVK